MRKRNLYLIFGLIVVVIAALTLHVILRPDRNASLKIIYTNDMQGQVEYSDGQYAGYAKIAALRQQFLDDGAHVLMLDAGNCLGDHVAAEMDDGQSMISVMNATGYDALTPGPMDFVYGVDALSSLRAKANFPFLAANITKADGSTIFETYKILTINSVRIGIIGVTNGLSASQAQKSSLTIADPVDTVTNILEQMSGKTDAVIVLAYTGNTEVTKALAAIKGVNIVIESGCSEAYADTTDDGTLMAAGGPKGNVVGVASLDITKSSVTVDNQFYTASDYQNLTADTAVTDAILTMQQSQSTLSSDVVGSVTLSDNTDAATVSETAIGNLTADAMLHAASSEGAAVALIPDQSISGTLSSGVIRREQIRALFDDDLYLVAVKMTGGELRTALEKSFDNYPEADGFLQVSGISYTFNPSTAIGSRLSDVMVDGHKLDDARTYVVAMTNRLADTLGYQSESTGRVAVYQTISSVLTDYVQSISDASKNANGNTLSDGAEDSEETSKTETTSDTTRIRISD